MLAKAFEIKIALLGHVSVGKTTVLNALLGEKFSEVSMRKTTSGINHFRVSNDTNKLQAETSSKEKDSSSKNTVLHDETIVSSKDTLKQITKDNNLLRVQNIIKESVFDVKLDQQLFSMRNDTRLVLTDIPGINEAHASEKYIKYVKDSWKSFDW